RRTKVLPNVPTFAEQGFPSIQASSWFAMYAPPKTAAVDIDTLNRAVNKVLALADVADRLLALGLEVGGGSPGDLQRLMEVESNRWGPVIRASGFRAD
ncbi:MAG: hypothetical protein RLZZ126_1663, partial [Pseudomonadota bacterium]